MKQMNIKKQMKFSMDEFKGIFCCELYNRLQSGMASREFVKDMEKRGFLKDSKGCKEVENGINNMIHGDRDFFTFCISLQEKQIIKNGYIRMVEQMEEEYKELMADSDGD